MNTFTSAAVGLVLGMLAISGRSAHGQEGIVSWNSAFNNSGGPVVRTNRQLVPNERIEIDVVRGVRGLKVGIGRTDGSPFARIWQPNETEQGKKLSFTMSATTQVGLGVSEGDGPLEQASANNAKDSAVLSYGSDAVVLRVKVIRPGAQPAQPAAGSKPSPDDDEPASPRWEKVVLKGKPMIQTKESIMSKTTITVQPRKVVDARWVGLGVFLENTNEPYLDNPTWLHAAAKPIEKQLTPGFNATKGLIQIGKDYLNPEEPEVKSFKGYDKLTFKDGTVYIVKFVK